MDKVDYFIYIRSSAWCAFLLYYFVCTLEFCKLDRTAESLVLL